MSTLLEMSITGAILIAVIVIVRAVGISRLPKKAFLALWTVAALRLLLPFSIPSPTSVWTAAQYAGMNVRRSGILLSQSPATAAVAAPAVNVLFCIWAVAVLASAMVFLFAHLRSRGRYRVSLPVEDPFVKAWLEEHRLRRPVQVRCSDQITSPLTYGVLWPVILLPKCLDREDRERLAYILAHELCHIRRFDALWKWVLAAALCLHWFNPLVWVMYLLANRDLELSCDEQVLREYGRDSRASYALTLVSLEEKRAHFTPLASSFSKNAMEERITAIMKSKKTTIAGIAAALALVVVVTTVFATNAAPRKMPDGSLPTPELTATPAPAASGHQTVSKGGIGIMDRPGKVDVFEGMGGWDASQDGAPKYSQAQYDLVIGKLKFHDYEKMSIAEFNRTLNAVFSDSELSDTGNYEDSLHYAYDTLLMTLPEDDPNAAYLLNTVQASLNEYQTRVSEVYSDKRIDPSFSGNAEHWREQDIYGDKVRTNYIQGHYTFTYRILDQEQLTVAERDAFLQAVMQGAQDYLDSKTTGELIDDEQAEANFKAAVEAAGKAASSKEIEFTGCEVDYYEAY